jgi:IS1 family transposase
VKTKNVPESKRGQFDYGDIWTWTAIDADTKLCVSWLVSTRDAGADIEHATLMKICGVDPQGEKRYSPPVCLGCESKIVSGDPNPKHISTSYVERQNLTMRMHNRRFTRLTNAFSKKVENHEHSIALHFMHYNFVKIHQTLRVTPAMAAGVTDRLWSIEDMVSLVA